MKRLVILLAVPAAMFWSGFSIYRVMGLGLTLLFFAVVPYYVHRTSIKKVLARDGFRLTEFSSGPGAFVSRSWNWPWWAEHYSYGGTVSTDSNETFDCWFVVEGAVFALILPKLDYYIVLRRFESWAVQDVINRQDDAKRLKELQQFPSIKHLDLQYAAITDEDLQSLKLWAHLQSLVIDAPGITDQGIESLKQLNHLKELRLERTSTTPAGRNQLRIALPNCDIFPEP